MAGSAKTQKKSFLARHYLVDCPSQLTVAGLTVSVMAGIGLLYAFAVYYLAGTDLLRARSVADTRLVLLLVHSAYFVVGGAILFVTVVLLTHRYAGPAVVMRRAVWSMRRGDFTARLALRKRDYHKDMAEKLRQLRDELAERDVAQVESLKHLEACLDEGNLEEARRLVRELFAHTAAERTKRGARDDAAAKAA